MRTRALVVLAVAFLAAAIPAEARPRKSRAAPAVQGGPAELHSVEPPPPAGYGPPGPAVQTPPAEGGAGIPTSVEVGNKSSDDVSPGQPRLKLEPAGGERTLQNSPPVTVLPEGPGQVRVVVREHATTRTIYAGPRLTKRQVKNLVAEWAKESGVSSQSFVEARDRKVFDDAKAYTDNKVAPLETRVAALEQAPQGRVAPEKANVSPPVPVPPTTSTEMFWRENPLLILAIILLVFTNGGLVAVLIAKYYRRNRS